MISQLIQCLKEHPCWKELVTDNDEVENSGIKSNFQRIVSPEFTVTENDRLAKKKELDTKYHCQVFMIK